MLQLFHLALLPDGIPTFQLLPLQLKSLSFPLRWPVLLSLKEAGLGIFTVWLTYLYSFVSGIDSRYHST